MSATDHQHAAREHLMLHFTSMANFEDEPVPIIMRGEGCYVFDAEGRRFIDGPVRTLLRQHRARLR